ncbi:mitotic regulator LTE1, partial [Ascoidea rubescens DSM 1968]
LSFILSYDSITLAKQFTLIEKDALSEVDWRELIDLQWSQELKPITSWLQLLLKKNVRGIDLVISRFNLTVNWIVSEILLTNDEKYRRDTISRFIHIANNCFKLQNYSTLMQIVLALTTPRIKELYYTWNKMDASDIFTLRTLETFAHSEGNFLKLRKEIESIIPSKGCIPFFGLYLSDLTFNASKPEPLDISDDDTLVNLERFTSSSKIVRNFIQCIQWSKLYDFEPIPEIISKCVYIKSLTKEEM